MTQPSSRSRVRTALTTAVAMPSGTPAVLAQVAVLVISITCLVLVSAVFDARLARDALALPAGVVAAATVVSACGQSGYMFALAVLTALACVLVRWQLRDRRYDAALTILAERAIYVLAVLAVSGILAQLFKHLIGRARPKLMQSFGPYHFDFLSIKNSLASFPSGHATTVFAMATALGLILPRLRVSLFLAAVLIAISRILVEAHYASDLVAGGALGVTSALAVTRFFAAWDFAFEADGVAVRLKARGLVVAAVTGRLGPP